MKKLLIVISGGGFAQIENALGCLCALKNRGYDLASPDIDWRGTSAGGIVATALALKNPVNYLINKVHHTTTETLIYRPWYWIARFITGGHIYNRDGFEKFLRELVDDKTAENVRVIVTNLATKAKEEMPGNYLSCLATSGINRIFPHTAINGSEYIDGGYVDNVPLDPYMLNEYKKILVVLPPRDAESERHKHTLIGRILQEVDLKISQEVNEAEFIFNQKKFYPNVTLLRPPSTKTSLLSLSNGYALISHAYHFAFQKLAEENF